MASDVGVPIKDFVDSVVASYKKGFDDALECLKGAQATIDIEKMKEAVFEDLKTRGKIKAEW